MGCLRSGSMAERTTPWYLVRLLFHASRTLGSLPSPRRNIASCAAAPTAEPADNLIRFTYGTSFNSIFSPLLG